jgi:hypothetical protein
MINDKETRQIYSALADDIPCEAWLYLCANKIGPKEFSVVDGPRNK